MQKHARSKCVTYALYAIMRVAGFCIIFDYFYSSAYFVRFERTFNTIYKLKFSVYAVYIQL